MLEASQARQDHRCGRLRQLRLLSMLIHLQGPPDHQHPQSVSVVPAFRPDLFHPCRRHLNPVGRSPLPHSNHLSISTQTHLLSLNQHHTTPLPFVNRAHSVPTALFRLPAAYSQQQASASIRPVSTATNVTRTSSTSRFTPSRNPNVLSVSSESQPAKPAASRSTSAWTCCTKLKKATGSRRYGFTARSTSTSSSVRAANRARHPLRVRSSSLVARSGMLATSSVHSAATRSMRARRLSRRMATLGAVIATRTAIVRSAGSAASRLRMWLSKRWGVSGMRTVSAVW